MPTSDYPLVKQLHADRTARIHSEQRMLQVPTARRPLRLFSRKQRTAAARLATSC